MTAIDSTMLAAMREAIEQLLPDTCDVLYLTRTSDGMGGMTETWGTTSSNVAFRLDVKQGMEQVAGGGLKPFTSYKGSLPYDTSITTTDRILHDGVTYAVTGVNTNQSWQAVMRVDLERV